MSFRTILVCLAGVALAGCASLPTAGPTASQVVDQQAQKNKARFDLVTVDSQVVMAMAARPEESFHAVFKRYGKPPQPRIGIGDSVLVSIWEAAGGGLFGASASDHLTGGSRDVTIPAQQVGEDGAISVPFAGRVGVAGKLPLEVQHDIEQRLAGKAIEPQVIVTIAKSVNDTVTVDGEVVHGARIPLSLNGERLLDAIAAAGGARSPIYQTFVELSRHGVTATIPMATLVSDPEENIYARPGDVLTLVRIPQTFSVFGAVGANADLPFSADRMTLIEGLAKAGGLQDERSDPNGVFLFRFEPPAIVRALGQPVLGTGPDGTTPVVYRLNFRDARAYFLAQRFPLKNKDIIYVANAQLDELQKFFTLLNTVTGPVITGIVVSNTTP